MSILASSFMSICTLCHPSSHSLPELLLMVAGRRPKFLKENLQWASGEKAFLGDLCRPLISIADVPFPGEVVSQRIHFRQPADVESCQRTAVPWSR
jgi:hypothetical protein